MQIRSTRLEVNLNRFPISPNPRPASATRAAAGRADKFQHTEVGTQLLRWPKSATAPLIPCNMNYRNEAFMKPPHRIFVYGTLRQGYKNPFAERLRGVAKFLGMATMRGELYLCTRGPFPYPAACYLPHAESQVVGEVYEFASGSEILGELDRYEGVGPGFPVPHEYERTVVSVLCDSRPCEAWCYLANHPVTPGNRIPSGDFTQAVPPAHT